VDASTKPATFRLSSSLTLSNAIQAFKLIFDFKSGFRFQKGETCIIKMIQPIFTETITPLWEIQMIGELWSSDLTTEERLWSVFIFCSVLSLLEKMVGHSGIEPETSVLSGLRSNQLS
jgi:hypothetical protein